MRIYKIKNKATGKYKSAGDHWTSKGKAYTEMGHVTSALKGLAPSVCRNHFWYKVFSKLGPGYNHWNLPEPYKAEYTILRSQGWESLIETMPELVIEVWAENGIREVTIKDWIESRDKGLE